MQAPTRTPYSPAHLNIQLLPNSLRVNLCEPPSSFLLSLWVSPRSGPMLGRLPNAGCRDKSLSLHCLSFPHPPAALLGVGWVGLFRNLRERM